MAIKRLFALGVPFSIGALVLAGCNTTAAHSDTLAYWRFEEGKPGEYAPVGKGSGVDSVGPNALTVYGWHTRPLYTGDVPLATVPQTGTPNQVAVQLNYGDDYYSPDIPIDTYDFSPTGSNAWTVELSFKMTSLDGVARLFGRDGATQGVTDGGPLQIVVNGKGNKFNVGAEIVDGANTFKTATSPADYILGRWYNLAATADANTLKVYMDTLDGKGYQLVAQQNIQGALSNLQGLFSVGRGFYGHPTDNISGLIDEVRLSNGALLPSQFLFANSNGNGVVGPAPTPFAPPAPITIFPGADPDAIYAQNKFWLYITSQNDIGPKNPVMYAFSSPDLKNWTKGAKPILQFKDIPWIYTDGANWHGAWAPTTAEKNGKYYFYYSVGPQSGDRPSRIGVAVGNSPAGPFKDSGKALPIAKISQGFEAIDPMVFRDPKSGKYYMYAGGSAGSKLRVWEMAPDMVSFAREIPVDTPPQFTEGSFIHYANGRYYFSYSHGSYNNGSYSVHYATSSSPLGPWQYRGPILQSDMTRKGPGHHSFVQDPRTKQWYIVYHRWQSPNNGNPFKAKGGRSLAIQRIQYDATGAILPIVMTDEAIPKLVK